MIPAGFMQVANRGRFVDALNLQQVFGILRYHFFCYVEAWIYSLWLTMLAMMTGPFAPWSIIWSYQGIVYAFNEVLALSDVPMYQQRMNRSRFAEFRVSEARGI